MYRILPGMNDGVMMRAAPAQFCQMMAATWFFWRAHRSAPRDRPRQRAHCGGGTRCARSDSPRWLVFTRCSLHQGQGASNPLTPPSIAGRTGRSEDCPERFTRSAGLGREAQGTRATGEGKSCAFFARFPWASWK